MQRHWLMIGLIAAGLLVLLPLVSVRAAENEGGEGTDETEVASDANAEPSQAGPDYTKGEKPSGGVQWNLGPTGITGYVSRLTTRQILILEITAGSPAEGRLEANDVILGIVSPAAGQDT